MYPRQLVYSKLTMVNSNSYSGMIFILSVFFVYADVISSCLTVLGYNRPGFDPSQVQLADQPQNKSSVQFGSPFFTFRVGLVATLQLSSHTYPFGDSAPSQHVSLICPPAIWQPCNVNFFSYPLQSLVTNITS